MTQSYAGAEVSVAAGEVGRAEHTAGSYNVYENSGARGGTPF